MNALKKDVGGIAALIFLTLVVSVGIGSCVVNSDPLLHPTTAQPAAKAPNAQDTKPQGPSSPEASPSTLNERTKTFLEIEGSGVRYSDLLSAVRVQGYKLTFVVTPLWSSKYTRDDHEAAVKQWFTTWAAMGAARGIHERPDDYRIEVVNALSDRQLAGWNGWGGYSESR